MWPCKEGSNRRLLLHSRVLGFNKVIDMIRFAFQKDLCGYNVENGLEEEDKIKERETS